MKADTKPFSPIRDALGQHNDPSQSIELLVKRLVDSRDRMLNELQRAKPDAERYRKMLSLGNGWLGKARAMANNGGASIDEQLDSMPDWPGVKVGLPPGTGAGYRIPGHPTEQQLQEVCKALRPDWPQLGAVERDKIKTKAKAAWRAIAGEINENTH